MYHANIGIKSTRSNKEYSLNVDIPDYETNDTILSELAKFFKTRQLENIVQKLFNKSVTFPVQGVKWTARVVQNNTNSNDSKILNMEETTI